MVNKQENMLNFINFIESQIKKLSVESKKVWVLLVMLQIETYDVQWKNGKHFLFTFVVGKVGC